VTVSTLAYVLELPCTEAALGGWLMYALTKRPGKSRLKVARQGA
jgi:hypothetical protein